jgi:DNA-binding XRE family transcriptional regulator
MPRVGADPQARVLGQHLRAARHASGKTLRVLAAEMGVTPSTISRWETGRRSVDHASWQIARALLARHLRAMDDVHPQAVVRGGFVHTNGMHATAFEVKHLNEGGIQ